MKKITNFIIDRSDLVATAPSIRSFTVSGEKDAEFILQVFDTPSSTSDPVAFYDFATKSFSTTFTSASSLNVKMKSTIFVSNISFPVNASGDTYTILLLTPPNKDTELGFGSGKNSYSTTIAQVVNATLTFTPSSGTSAAYGTPPTTTSTASPAITSGITETVDWTLTNTETDANGFGLILTRQPLDTDWYFTTTETVDSLKGGALEAIYSTVNGETSSSTAVTIDADYREAAGGQIDTGFFVLGTGVTGGTTVAAVNVGDDVYDLTLSAAMSIGDGVTLTFIKPDTRIIVDDLTDLVEGMYVTAASGTNAYLNGTPTIVNIDTDTKMIELSARQGFADGITLTFQARGSSAIQEVTGANIDFSNWNANVDTVSLPTPFTKTIRATGSNTVIALNNTYGLTGGGYVTISGLNVVNTSANTIQSVSADADGAGTDGTITVQVAQTTNLAVGTKINISGDGIGLGSRETLDIDNEITINSYPSTNRTIYLNLDNFITVGTAS